MNQVHDSPDAVNKEVNKDQTVIVTPAPGSAAGSRQTAQGDISATLQVVALSILGGAAPLQFMDSINAGNRQLGNRAFLRWVGALRATRREREIPGDCSRGLQGPVCPPAAMAPLQFGPKKRRKKKAEPAPAMTSPAEPSGDTPQAGERTLAGPEPTLPRAASGAAAAPALQKKKRKSRVQVALNTLRAEGPEVFKGYIEAELGETMLLRTLTERIMRAEDLAAVREEALAAVEQRLRLLDPEADPAIARTVASGREQDRDKAVAAPEKTSFSIREQGLFECCIRGDLNRLRRLLRISVDDINMACDQGTLLVFAAYHGHTSIVRELLAIAEIDVNLAQKEGATPLFLAAQNGHIGVVKLLLAAPRIKLNLKSSTGTTPLGIAAVHGRVEVTRLLLEQKDTAVNVKGLDGATPLFIAAQESYPGMVELLLKRGADVNLTIDGGTSPLCIAAAKGNYEVVRLLLQCPDIQVDMKSAKKASALIFACQSGHEKIVQALLDKKADPGISGILGMTPLHFAVLHGHTAVVEMLLHAGADLDAEMTLPGHGSYTPEAYARLYGRMEIADRLAAYRRNAAGQAAGLEYLSLEEQTDRPSKTETAEARTSLSMAKQALIQGTLDKLQNNSLDQLEGIRLLEDVNAAAGIDGLCTLHNRLAQIERQQERARRHGRRSLLPACAGPDPAVVSGGTGCAAGQAPRLQPQGQAAAAAPLFALGERTGLDADAIESVIKVHLGQPYHRFVSQAVNDMEFGRGKPTSGYPGLLHASAGIPGVGSCSVFYYGDARQNRISIVGIGHHLDRETYQLDYAAGALQGCRTVRLS